MSYSLILHLSSLSVCVCVSISVSVSVFVSYYIYMCTHTHMHMHTHAHIQTHTHARVYMFETYVRTYISCVLFPHTNVYIHWRVWVLEYKHLLTSMSIGGYTARMSKQARAEGMRRGTRQGSQKPGPPEQMHSKIWRRWWKMRRMSGSYRLLSPPPQLYSLHLKLMSIFFAPSSCFVPKP